MLCAVLLAAISVSTNAVTFTAKATGLEAKATVEFVLAAPGSDRDYESLLLADDPIADLARAFRAAGIPGGTPCDAKSCVFWPTGARVAFEPPLDTLLADVGTPAKDRPLPPVVYAGGDGDGTNMPLAVFATYTLGQSLFLFDDRLDQSLVYGRFQPRRTLKKGEPVAITVRWDGVSRSADLTPDFPGDKTVGEAVRLAQGLDRADSREARVNGFRKGQFYYRAFLPLEKWRERESRLTQPVEIRIEGTNVAYTVVDEDWSGEGTDPRLLPRRVDLNEAIAAKADTCFIFVSTAEKLSRLYEIKAKFPPRFANWYVFPN